MYVWVCIIQLLCKCNVCCMCVRMFVVKTKGVKGGQVLTYIHVCVCVCSRVNKKVHSSKACVYAQAKGMFLYEWVDVDIHVKFIILKDDKSINYIRTFHVFSLAVCFLIFGCVLQSCCLELWLAWRDTNVGGCVSAWEQKRKIFLKA